MATRDRRNALRLLCTGFSSDEVGALRSLLGLLDQYLKQAWHIIDAGDADLVLRNLDARDAYANAASPQIVGCALKPRTHPCGTIHRPLRAAEILSVLNGYRNDLESRMPVRDGIEWSYRLRCWPLDLAEWPKDSWRVLAIMTPVARTVDEISARSGLPVIEIESYIARLHAASLIERLADRCVALKPAKIDSSVWRGLAQRVGRALGFGS